MKMPKVGESLTKEQTSVGMERLKPQQQKFLDGYFNGDLTQTGAARAAGYKNATVAAVRLLRNPIVQERLEEMRLEARTRYGVTVDKSVRDLKKIRDEAWQVGKYGEAIRAEELRLKATGLLVNKSHVVHEDVSIMGREEVLEKLAEFSRMAERRMKDITPASEDVVEIASDSEEAE
jgi:phage terminase small subunit